MRLPLDQALQIVGLSMRVLESTIGSIPDDTPDVWRRRTEAFHRLIKESRKSLLRRIHPDVNDDPDATEKTQRVNWVADELLRLSIGPRPQPVRVVRYVTIVHSDPWTSTTSSTTNWW